MSTSLTLLQKYLTTGEWPTGPMQLSELDGFLTGIACSPEPIAPSEWLKVLWSSSKPSDADKRKQADELILDRFWQIVDGLSGVPSHIRPVLWSSEGGHTIGLNWCEGFIDAYTLRLESWVALAKTPEGKDLLFPIMAHLFDDDGKSLMGIPDDEIEATLDFAAQEISNTVPLIYAFWQSKR